MHTSNGNDVNYVIYPWDQGVKPLWQDYYTTTTTTGTYPNKEAYTIKKAENGYILEHMGKNYVFATKQELASKIAELVE